MSEKPTEEQNKKDFFDYLQEKKGANLWDINQLFEDDDSDLKYLKEIFNPQQLAIIGAIIKKTVAAIDWHDGKDSDAHPDLREQVNTMDAKLRNHRHESTKQYTAKPEF